MNNIKMLLFDLDDTLLNGEKIISARTRNALWSAKDSGVRIGYITARTSWSAGKVIMDVPIDAAAYCSGASVYCEDRLFYETSIPGELGRHIIEHFRERFPERNDFTVFGPYSHFRGGDLWKDGAPCDEKEEDVRGRHGYQRIVLLDTTKEEIRDVAGDNVSYIITRYGGLAITAPGVCKGHAAGHIASYYGLGMTEIAAFGDDISDFSMLRTCGTGVAMENAVYEVKSVADYITDSYDSEGVAKWIEKHILGQE